MVDNDNVVSGSMPDEFDRLFGQLDGLPDVVKTGQSTKRVVPFMGVGGVKTYIVQTVRHREQGDTIFLEYMDGRTSLRLIIPPEVAEVLARQRDALSTKSRRKAGKARAEALIGIVGRGFTAEMRAKAVETRKANAEKRKARKLRGKRA